MGSKNRISKFILPIILSERKRNQCWVEPFVGGGNIIDKVSGERIGADIDPYAISALISIRDHLDELPKNNKEFTELDYKRLKMDDDYRHKGYAAFAFSYGGKLFGGWRRDSIGARDYVNEAYLNAFKQSKKLQGVTLIVANYVDLKIPEDSLIYCDPPYSMTTRYKHQFNHDIFWQWCRDKDKEGHTIFISEYNAPDDFECVWSKRLVSSLTKDTGGKIGIEKLFRIKRY